MEQENKANEITNNYCVNDNHLIFYDVYHCCLKCGVETDIVTGKLNVKSARTCSWARAIKCQGNHFEPKISMRRVMKDRWGFNRTREELLSYKSLPVGWDGYGGVAANESLVNTATVFVSQLEELGAGVPVPSLSGGGYISLYWNLSDKNSYVEVMFEDSGYYTYFCQGEHSFVGEEDVSVESEIPEELLCKIRVKS